MTDLVNVNDILSILLIVIGFLVLIIFILSAIQLFMRQPITILTFGWIPVGLLIITLALMVLVTYRGSELNAADWAQITLMIGLVAITGFYAFSASKQANASVKMAEEMRAQRKMASRPVIIQKAVFKSIKAGSPPDFDYFEIYNAGNVPAIEVEISLFNKDKKRRSSEKRNFLGGSESTKFHLEWDLTTYVGSTCYLVSEYQSIYSHNSQTWYQTWLPFQIGQIQETGKIIVLPGDLEFKDEVSEKDRIDAFSRKSKPK